jgi:hypothetical protein
MAISVVDEITTQTIIDWIDLKIWAVAAVDMELALHHHCDTLHQMTLVHYGMLLKMHLVLARLADLGATEFGDLKILN